ncbi:glycosyltransferase family 4 protein [Pseudomonas sp. MM213]|uniref:glycosyltransferase family 4 protein n=1 Tax=Pseudomonas sp. MM213 TaxID=2866807 RepID=UPI001CF45367|nr:glycosyltransferase family 4 protein [Pseudomonas sp. MM213]UCP11864.1 glycosyltransferase family 4 protein [Pseudomonas sp. MM213]
MRIAYFINQYPKVSHSFIRREILALERQGFEVQRIALRGWDAQLVDAEDVSEQAQTHYVLQGGVKALAGPVLQVLRAQPRRFFSTLWLALRMGLRADRPWPYHVIYLFEACRLLSWLQAFGARHVHAHFGTNSTEVVMLARALGGPAYSFTVHGPEEFDKPQFIHLGEKVRRAAFVAAISSYGRSQLFRWVEHAHWEKVKVVHCGLERAFHEVPAVAVPPVPRLVCVGRLCEQKGQLLLLEAARKLAAQGVVFEIVLAGDGEMRAEIETLIARHGLQAQVRITGWISSDQVRAQILAARALVLPSFGEGLPVVIMEAMALRRPVLTTYVAGIPELVRQGENGWLFPAGAVDELAVALADCLAQPVEVLQRMGDAAYQRVLERHDIDTEAAKLAELFKAHA